MASLNPLMEERARFTPIVGCGLRVTGVMAGGMGSGSTNSRVGGKHTTFLPACAQYGLKGFTPDSPRSPAPPITRPNFRSSRRLSLALTMSRISCIYLSDSFSILRQSPLFIVIILHLASFFDLLAKFR